MQNATAVHAWFLGASVVEIVWGLANAINLGGIADRLARWITRTRSRRSSTSAIDTPTIRRIGLALAATGVLTGILTLLGVFG